MTLCCMGVKALELDGKVVVVVGASRGCGKYFAMGLAKEGATVIVGARTASPGGPLPGTIYETAQQITDAGGKAWPVRCDATIPGDLHHIVGQAVYRYGRIDALVYNAAVYDREPFTNITPDAFDRYFAVNVKGPFIAAQAAVPHMVKQGGGSIVNITSASATRTSMDHLVLYSITKAALDRLSTWLSKECHGHNIAVNSLSPGPVITEALEQEVPDDFDFEAGGYGWRPATAEYLGPPVVHLVKQRADGITGQVMRVPDYGKTWP